MDALEFLFVGNGYSCDRHPRRAARHPVRYGYHHRVEDG